MSLSLPETQLSSHYPPNNRLWRCNTHPLHMTTDYTPFFHLRTRPGAFLQCDLHIPSPLCMELLNPSFWISADASLPFTWTSLSTTLVPSLTENPRPSCVSLLWLIMAFVPLYFNKCFAFLETFLGKSTSESEFKSYVIYQRVSNYYLLAIAQQTLYFK